MTIPPPPPPPPPLPPLPPLPPKPEEKPAPPPPPPPPNEQTPVSTSDPPRQPQHETAAPPPRPTQQPQQHHEPSPPRPPLSQHQAPPPPPPLQEGAPSFQDIVTNVLMETEEFRRKLNGLAESVSSKESKSPSLTPHDCFAVRYDMEDLMTYLYQPSLVPRNEVETELRRHCQLKTADVALLALKTLNKYKPEPDPDDPENDEEHAYNGEEEKECQACIARIAELNLVLLEPEPESKEKTEREDQMVEMYSNYQKTVLRKRVKPSIARLVDYRKRQEEHVNNHHHQSGAQHHDSDSDEDDDDDDSSKSQHVRVITTILGQASALIHPLMMWKSNLPPQAKALNELCDKSMSLVDEQAQTMTQTVSTWFLQDTKIDTYWTPKSASEESCLDQLGELDGVVEQLAFCCQVFDRYIELVHPEADRQAQAGNDSNNSNSETVILQQMHPEWTWKYASMERYLTTQQLQSALQLANPVQIVVGTPIQVPSVVEDAQYLSTRALKRAASTRSHQAIGTVAHSIASDVWSTDMAKGVHEALVEQRGCYDENAATQAENAATNQAQSPTRGAASNSSSFASALMGALDEDLVSDNNNVPSSSVRSPPKTPSSGGFLGSLSSSLASSVGVGSKLDQIRLDTFLCALNGIHSASAACTSLVHFLDSLLEIDEDEGVANNKSDNSQSMSMIHLAREELNRFSKNYLELLNKQSTQVVTQFCGTWQDAPAFKGNLFPVLRYYLERENYNLTSAKELAAAEDDAHLHKILIQPMQSSILLRQFEKCDLDVLRALCERIAQMLVDLFLDIILSKSLPKQFTDWGSLLFSKQVRMIQNYLQSLMQKAASIHHQGAVPVLTSHWERLSQAVAILQLEKPSDWAFYQSTSAFSPQELQSILELRVDFSADAIANVVASVSPKEG